MPRRMSQVICLGILVVMFNIAVPAAHADLAGWLWSPGPDTTSANYAYSMEEGNWLYFSASEPVWYYNYTRQQWTDQMPAGSIYVQYPYMYADFHYYKTWLYVLPPVSGLHIYHYATGQWSVWSRQ